MSRQMKEVRLYGHLGRRFGKIHHFALNSPVEAFAALRANFPGFADEGNGGHCRIFVGFDEIEAKQVGHPTGREVIRIVPVVHGSGIEASILIGDMIMYATAAYESSALFALAVNYLATAAVSALLSPSMKSNVGSGGNEKADNKPSYAFNGAVNTSAQGNPIAVGYGRLLIGSQVIYAGLGVEQI